jgi:hypothetical protein
MSDVSWGIASIWNKSLDMGEDRAYEPRDYGYASELGGSYFDRYYKMHGRTPTTPANARARRKFQGGLYLEWVVEQVLVRAGLYQSSQDRVYGGDEYGMKVSGKVDFLAGGDIQDVDPEMFKDMPESIALIAANTATYLKEQFPDGLREIIIEVKSTSGMMFDRYLEAPNTGHALQAFHYAHNLRKPALLVYISRDDLRVCEYLIMPDTERWLKLYQADIKRMAEVYLLDEPPQPPFLTYEKGKFAKNWHIEYSNYLTDFGYDRSDEYKTVATSVAGKLNRIVKHIKAGKELTKVNLKSLDECYSIYPHSEEIICGLLETREASLPQTAE